MLRFIIDYALTHHKKSNVLKQSVILRMLVASRDWSGSQTQCVVNLACGLNDDGFVLRPEYKPVDVS